MFRDILQRLMDERSVVLNNITQNYLDSEYSKQIESTARRNISDGTKLAQSKATHYLAGKITIYKVNLKNLGNP